VAADGFVRDHQDPALVRRVGTWHRPRLRAFPPAGAKPPADDDRGERDEDAEPDPAPTGQAPDHDRPEVADRRDQEPERPRLRCGAD